ncbi:Signal transduction histidine kinase [Paramicrobacterium humi]|uniref:histidine kinase n=1 Tax=Paramicrobacterium humi TaxID=640635 RepID=A0A1H4M7A7_9MICO|nr:histidine kinase [Microbacterium humi]SEB78697.1 Signal transduction histidine kinase [Microbacterium humi]
MSILIDPTDAAWRRPAATERQLRGDLIGGLVLFCCMVPSAVLHELAGAMQKPAPMWVTIIWALVLCGAISVRRRWPSIVALVVAAAYIAGMEAGTAEFVFSQIVLFISLYTVGAWVPDRVRGRFVRGAVIGAMFMWLLFSIFHTATDPSVRETSGFATQTALLAFWSIQTITNLLYFGGAVYFGNHTYAAARQRAELEYRSEQLERERERTAAQAVALERVRIARELHDVVAHHVSVMGVQAGAARTVLESNPDAARGALAHVESNARAAIDELHALVGTLRESENGEQETPDHGASTIDLSALQSLVDESTAAKMPTTLEVLGEPRDVPGVVAVSVYRIAQEALTNARKYAGSGASADVRVRFVDGDVELEVTNTGSVPGRPRKGGLGQIGMRERVSAVGGAIEMGPRSRGGYLVRARIPLPERAEPTGARA